MGDYLIRVPAEWLLEVHGSDAWIDADRLSGHEVRPFAIVAEIPEDTLAVRVDYDRPLQPGETRYSEGGNSVHMHSGPDCPCGWKLGGNGGYVGNAAPNLRFPTTASAENRLTED